MVSSFPSGRLLFSVDCSIYCISLFYFSWFLRAVLNRSHNFRPSYMRLKASMLRSELKAECVLAMTATATTMTLQAVMSALEIPSTNVIQKSQLRDNFELTVSLSGANR